MDKPLNLILFKVILLKVKATFGAKYLPLVTRGVHLKSHCFVTKLHLLLVFT